MAAAAAADAAVAEAAHAFSGQANGAHLAGRVIDVVVAAQGSFRRQRLEGERSAVACAAGAAAARIDRECDGSQRVGSAAPKKRRGIGGGGGG